jgi:hypothetical protein
MAKQTFTTGQVLTAAQMTSLQQTAMLGGAASAKTASYTLVATDAGTAISMSNASATTITVNTALFAAGDTVQITNLGAGVCTITAGTATVNSSASLALAQYESGTLNFTSSSAAIFIKGAGAAAASGGMTLLSTLDLTGVSSATTSAFSSDYKQIFIYLRGLYAASANDTNLRLNGDTGATKYTANFILGSGGVVSTGATGGDSKYYIADLTTDSTARYQNSAFITIMKPSNTSKFFISSSAMTYVAGVKNFQTVGTYDGSAALTTVTIFSGVNFTAGTAEVYGVN